MLCLCWQGKDLRALAGQLQHVMASLNDVEALATAVKKDAAASSKVRCSCAFSSHDFVCDVSLRASWLLEAMSPCLLKSKGKQASPEAMQEPKH